MLFFGSVRDAGPLLLPADALTFPLRQSLVCTGSLCARHPVWQSCSHLQVVRNRNKWKCTLKQGIVHIDGREYVFGKANGDFVF